MKSRPLDMESYPRREHYRYYLTLPNPFVGVTVNVDVTDFRALCKAKGWSFYMAFNHAAALAANRIEAFRLRADGDGISVCDECGTSHIELLDDGTFCYCPLKHGDMTWDGFMEYAEETRKLYRERASLEEDADIGGMYFVTCTPWFSFTALTLPNDGASNPHISWGKYEPDFRGRYMLPLNLTVHHGLVDGVHIGQFFRYLDEEIAGAVRALTERN